MPDVPLNGITLHYEVDGGGPPLLLLSGMLSDSATWAVILPQLAEHFTVIRPDNRTTGRTVLADAPADVALMAKDALALMAHLGHDRFCVAGHSLGGLLSLELAALAAERVTKIGVLASGRVRSPRTMSVFETLLDIRKGSRGEEMWLRALYPWIFGQAFFESADNIELALAAALAYPHAQSTQNMERQIAAFRAFRPQAELAQIKSPALILYAGQDLLVPPAHARPSFAPLSNKTEITIEEAGHSIVWDAPQEVASHLLEFFSDSAA